MKKIKILLIICCISFSFSFAQEKLEVSEFKLGVNISLITDVNKIYIERALPWTKEDIKYFIFEKDINLFYNQIKLRSLVLTTWKNKICEIDLSIKSFESQEKIFAMLEKKYGKMIPDYGKCDKKLAVCWYNFQNDTLTISNCRLVKDQFKINGVRTNFKISDKFFLKEYYRLDSINMERIKKMK